MRGRRKERKKEREEKNERKVGGRVKEGGREGKKEKNSGFVQYEGFSLIIGGHNPIILVGDDQMHLSKVLICFIECILGSEFESQICEEGKSFGKYFCTSLVNSHIYLLFISQPNSLPCPLHSQLF